jgi:hypothetical protein
MVAFTQSTLVLGLIVVMVPLRGDYFCTVIRVVESDCVLRTVAITG